MAQIDDIGIDLGTSSFIVYMKGQGIVLREPSSVALNRETRQIIAIGTEAREMTGRTPSSIAVVRPLSQGEMIDFDLTGAMIRHLIGKVIGKRMISRPRAIMSVPTGIKDVEKKALISVMLDAGLKRAQLIEKTVAAALGAQLRFSELYGLMIADMSAGGTDIAVLYNGLPAVMNTLHIGGDHLDESIIRYLRKKHNLLIGERTAEQVKLTLGGAVERESPVYMDITGRNLISGLPKTITVDSSEIYESLQDCITDLIEGMQVVIERTPPQLASDILDRGITLTGGASLLFGLSDAISSAIKIPCNIAAEPKDCVAIGCSKVLENPNGTRHLLYHA